MRADQQELEAGQTANVLAYQVHCCEGPVSITLASTYAKSEGRVLIKCPRCKTDWMVMTYLRRINRTNTERKGTLTREDAA